MKNILQYFQRIGAALMVPVAVLPAAAILLGIGYWIDSDGWGSKNSLAALFIKSGFAIIDEMPMLFAIGIAFGLSKDKHGSAALTGFVSFMVVKTLCSPTSVEWIIGFPEIANLSGAHPHKLAFEKINNQFIGILVGLISAYLYNIFSEVQLPRALSFFNGKRLVPIIASFAMILLSVVLMFLWPAIFSGLVAFGNSITGLGNVGAGIYGFFNRLLIPIGLHHALNAVFWFDIAGINDINKFLGGAESIQSGIAEIGVTGRYQAGFFPIMMFGLPAAALAIYQCSRPANRERIAGIMMAGAFASFFTGITEPLEFAFMFVAPPLYFLHAVLTGISVYIAASMQWISGFGFSAGFVDLVLSAKNPLAVNWYMLLVQGVVFFFIYYFSFRFAILKFNLMTPGREVYNDTTSLTKSGAQSGSASDLTQLAKDYLEAAGGVDNVLEIDACITRLRLTVRDNTLIKDAKARELGAAAVVRPSTGTVQIVVGMRAEAIASAMKNLF